MVTSAGFEDVFVISSCLYITHLFNPEIRKLNHTSL